MNSGWVQTLLDAVIMVVVFTLGYWTHKLWKGNP